MTRHRMTRAAAVALVATLALAGCKKEEAAPPAASMAAKPVVPAPPPAPAPTVLVGGVDLGSAVGADKKITVAGDTFKHADTIYIAVTTLTSDPDASVPGKLEAKWTFEDGQTVKDDSVDAQFKGAGMTDFSISNPKGLASGKYQVDVSLNGKLAQSKGFGVE